MNRERSEHYRHWAAGFHDSVRGNVGFVAGDVLHLWHGRSEDRRYRERNAGLRRFQFDPATDIALDANGAWRWNSDKPELHAYVRDYFAGRREDG
jgi:hypothetical protein